MNQHYDVDVAVIGAGPAGLSAAIRLGWIKGFEAIPVSVLLIDPEPPGGLAAIGGCVLTGPHWACDAAGIVGPLVADIETLNIQQVQARAIAIESAGNLKRVRLDNGETILALAVIIATGFRVLHGEANYFNRQLFITYKGYSYFPALISQAAKAANKRGLVVVGNHKTVDLIPLFAPHVEAAGKITLLLQPPCSTVELVSGVELIWGCSSAYLGESTVEGVRYRPNGQEADEQIDCGAIFIDYHAFEQMPELWPVGQSVRYSSGFIEVDAHMVTPEAGLFAAGDVTGRYASTSMAIGDGICAAFSAYRYVFQIKFKREPSLFAYAASGSDPVAYLAASERGYPFDLPSDGLVVALAEPEKVTEKLVSLNLISWSFASPPTVESLRQQWQLSAEATNRTLFDLIYQRLITIHHNPG